jgi:hypothetical protein
LKVWRPRVFKVNREDRLLLYWLPSTTPRASKPRGVLPLTGCTIRAFTDDSPESSPFAFIIVHPWLRAWVLAASSATERDRWITILKQLALVISPSEDGAK